MCLGNGALRLSAELSNNAGEDQREAGTSHGIHPASELATIPTGHLGMALEA